ncbi:hypothetical protein [Lysinibacillus sp. ZYM-1]|uniref:hypothetical protein n=1 Tax=Lysinibacillus sp. ZYM-1 TaxID=1681184 RepID=UPI0006CE62C3|nr:hypothetical protein [Lysinibacillus sp. ZYM-1]KPN94804.1 hypothetical protein AO843_04705 [Lysinibacillus sp. ZYM-1]
MKIQSSNTSNYLKVEINKNIKNESLLNLFRHEDENNEEDKKNNKSRLEIRNENGYIRKYIVKPDGQRVLIMEVKQTQENIKESGDLNDIAQDMLMQQLEKSSNPQKYEQITSVLEKEKNIYKYKSSI